ncbi:hypothetical protein ADUPG1_000888, partial [Aduncisulcus paluster]
KEADICGPFEEISFKDVDDDLRNSRYFLNNLVCIFLDQDIDQVLLKAGKILLCCDDKINESLRNPAAVNFSGHSRHCPLPIQSGQSRHTVRGGGHYL